MKKILDLVESSILYDFLNCGKCRQKRRIFGSSPSENLFLENGASDVSSRTDFPAITVKSTHFLQPADLFSLFIDCGGKKMPTIFVAARCSNQKDEAKGISLHVIHTHHDFRSQQHVNATLPLAYCYSAL